MELINISDFLQEINSLSIQRMTFLANYKIQLCNNTFLNFGSFNPLKCSFCKVEYKNLKKNN